MIVKPQIINNVCKTSHPTGCAKEVENQINYVKSQPKITSNIKNALVLGASGGYGLASRIVLAYSMGATTMGVSFERAASEDKTATPGWYNNKAFSEYAKRDGLKEKTIIGDAFLKSSKENITKEAKEFFGGKIDCIIYSLATGIRKDENEGITYRSTLKPIGKDYSGFGTDFMKEELINVEMPAASDEDIKSTVKVMGGEDWKDWIELLIKEDMLSENCITLAYSYIGPEMTKAIYRDGTIGKAKDDLEATALNMDKMMQEKLKGHAYVSVAKAVVTRASAVIPAMPLYISILFKVMKDKGIHEGCIEQMYRQFAEKIYSGKGFILDEENRLRLDDWEMREDVQKEVAAAWDKIKDNDSLKANADLAQFRDEYLHLHGFGLDGIDYDADVQI
ncbi:enoyl-ACP reductase FabV [Brachyspira sp.]|uniref:enoyl-ACP reductase FabV n=1 Tax=Brachyspira sp. TaxID=1977261 RepID=UPI002629E43B|nr:enoyl-ACP reductase FabV [Brachyspira sp.]